MPKTYDVIDCEAEAMVRRVMQDRHQRLHDLGVSITGLFVYAAKNKDGEPVGNALSHGGYPASATIRITSLAERRMGLGDAVLMIDGDSWKEEPTARRVAIIDHELTHLEPKPGKRGIGVQMDDLGRPKLMMRLHDFHFGGFHEVAVRNHESSVEKSTVERLLNGAVRQGWLQGF